MKFTFIKSDNNPNLDLVYINDLLDGELHSDQKSEMYLYVPRIGERLLYSLVDYNQARWLLVSERTKIMSEIRLD
jgi:hypothetical protein